MSASNRHQGTIPREQAVDMLVGDVMIASPKTIPPEARVGEVRRLLDRPNVRTVLFAEDGMFRGAIERDGLPADAPDDEAALRYADVRPLTVTPTTPMSQAISLLKDRTEPRLVVLDDDGVTLRGLICVNSRATGFCVR
jgi:CBS domain-containing protein